MKLQSQLKMCLCFFTSLVLLCLLWMGVKPTKAEDITLTEEQKKQLQESIQSQVQKMKESLEKVKNLSDMQKQEEISPNSSVQGQTSSEALKQETTSQKAISEPEWDGIYIVKKNGEYFELTPLSGAKAKAQVGALTGKKYISVVVIPSEVNFLSWEDFKGIFVKGAKLLSEVRIHKLRRSAWGLGKVFAFFQGAPGGEEYSIEDPGNNLYVAQMRCRTKSDSAYCEFKDRDRIKNYLKEGQNQPCLFILMGESPEKGGKAYAVCFQE